MGNKVRLTGGPTKKGQEAIAALPAEEQALIREIQEAEAAANKPRPKPTSDINVSARGELMRDARARRKLRERKEQQSRIKTTITRARDMDEMPSERAYRIEMTKGGKPHVQGLLDYHSKSKELDINLSAPMKKGEDLTGAPRS